MPQRQNPVVVVPGIPGSTLEDAYPLPPEELWTALLNREYERLALHSDDPRYEASEPALVRAGHLFVLGYSAWLRSLRHDLTERADRPTPVFPFPYDWRQDVAATARQLAAFVAEALDRTALLRHYGGADGLRVDLVAHSLGGLVIAEYLTAAGGAARVGKVATLGTPFRGSVEALVKLLTGMGNLAGPRPEEREREAARSMPAMYQLLPSYAGCLEDEAGSAPPRGLFDVAAWQPGVLASLEETIRLRAVDPGNPESRPLRARELLAGYLELAWGHRQRIERLRLERAGLAPADWLCVVGVGERTRQAARLTMVRGQPRYVLSDDDYVDDWRSDPASAVTGDGTVPLAGAAPAFLPRSALVAVAERDFGFWELRDRGIEALVGLHALLPSMALAQRLVLRHLRPSYRGRVSGRPVPGVTPEAWRPPIPGLALAE
ncbi:MAG: lipase/acyltransferase domain-containing protein [Thermoanaerobaculia bacterium]